MLDTKTVSTSSVGDAQTDTLPNAEGTVDSPKRPTRIAGVLYVLAIGLNPDARIHAGA